MFQTNTKIFIFWWKYRTLKTFPAFINACVHSLETKYKKAMSKQEKLVWIIFDFM